jgi:hypothetical protein
MSALVPKADIYEVTRFASSARNTIDSGTVRAHVVVVIIRMDEKPTHATCAF